MTTIRENQLLFRNQRVLSSTQVLPRILGLQKKSNCSFFSSFSLITIFLFSLFPIPFSMLFPFLIYLPSLASPPSISTQPPLFFRHLLPFTSGEDGGRNLVSCFLHCSSHFLINAANKADVFQLMQKQQATPGLKLPTAHCLPLSLNPYFPSECLKVP